MSLRQRSRLPPAVAVLIAVLLVALATHQYQWIGRLSSLERQRLHASLLEDGKRFTEDFDRELTRAFLYFHPEPSASADESVAHAARQLERWRAEAPWPGMVRDLLVARTGPDGKLSLTVLRPGGGSAPVPWPPALAGVRRHLETAEDHWPPFPWAAPVVPDLPGLILPLSFPPAGAPHEPALLVVRLDPRVLAGEILPELTRRHFGTRQGKNFVLAVVDDRGQPVFRSDPAVPLALFHRSDLRLGMFRLRPFHDLRGLWGRREEREEAGRRPSDGPGFRVAGPVEGRMHGGGLPSGWNLVIQHREGSLEAAVTGARHHNLAISLGILALLAVTSGLMVVTGQRAQRLARQQMELVAGVTHELHTPLTAIRLAGQNLADGVVADPQQVRRYGSLIEREGRRLTEMVGQMLDLAGIQSGRRVYQTRPETVESLIDGALDDCRGLLDERQVRVERDIPPDLPAVLVDAEALRRALRNLIENAVRHGGAEAWVGLRARPASNGESVEITVVDRGPGIGRDDLPHLFEPFYRGRDTAANGVPGSGLGLSIVGHIAEALGGRVSVTSAPGDGSAFTLHLPVAPRSA